MATTDRSASDLKEWDELATAAATNAPDLPQTEIPRAALVKLRDEMRELVIQRNLHQANKQQVSQRIAKIHEEGSKLATVLRVLAKQHYGNRSDKLVEFGIPPFRGRAKKAAPTTQPPTPTGPNPTTPNTPTPPAAK
ncbi:MAG: hypothetical protein QOF89_4047 [Acidobacteriota bacterium]|jgi:hypothetical protein|nr:hypothetical protein [Acidobacteriota bacterium]